MYFVVIYSFDLVSYTDADSESTVPGGTGDGGFSSVAGGTPAPCSASVVFADHCQLIRTPTNKVGSSLKMLDSKILIVM